MSDVQPKFINHQFQKYQPQLSIVISEHPGTEPTYFRNIEDNEYSTDSVQ